MTTQRKGMLELVILILGLASYTTLAIFRFSIGVLIPDILREFDVAKFLAGGLVTFSMVGMVSANFLAPGLSSRLGVRGVLTLGTLIMASGLFANGLSPDYATSVMAMVVAGVGVGWIVPSIYVIMGGVMPGSRGLMLGVTNGLFTIGGFIGALVSSSLSESSGWRAPFVLYGATALVISVAMAGTVRRSPRMGSPTRRGFGALFGRRDILLLAGAMGTGNFAFLTAATWLPSFLRISRGYDPLSVALAIGAFTLVGAVGSTLFGFASDRYGRKRVAWTVDLAAAVFGMAVFVTVPSYALVLLLVGLLGMFGLPFWNLQISAAQDIVEKGEMVAVTSLVQIVAWIGGGLGPAIAGAFLDLYPLESSQISIPLAALEGLLFGVSAIMLIFARGPRR